MYKTIHNGSQFFVIEISTNRAVFSAIYQRACINWINEKVGMINMINNWGVKMQTNTTTIKTFKKVKFESLQVERKEVKLKQWERDNKQLRFIVKSDYLNK